MNFVIYIFAALIYISFLFIGKTRLWPYIKRLYTVFSLIVPIGLYGTIKSVEVATGILMILTLLKYSEIEKERDLLNYYSLVFLYMAMSVILSDQILYLLYLYFHLYMIFKQIVQIKKIKLKSIKFKKILFLSSVFTFIIYFVIPQVSLGNFFRFNKKIATGGFSRSLSPGAFKELVQNNEVQFYADFKDDLKKSPYWRGITFDQTDGKFWSSFRGRNFNSDSVFEYDESVEEVANITLLKQEELPVLRLEETYPFANGRPLKSRSDYYDIQNAKVRRYKLVESSLSRGVFKRNLSYPKRLEKSRFYKEIQQFQNLDVQRKVRSLLGYLRDLKLNYSLEVPLDNTKNLDSFLFDYKTGYCEHFSSSFALGLRMLGVPANVVGGFYGGRLNNVGGIVIVSGSNAHAWTEYWNGSNWVRIDPVSEIASSTSLPESFIGEFGAFSENKVGSRFKIIDYLENVYLQLNAIFFSFDIDKQRELMLVIVAKFNEFKRSFKLIYLVNLVVGILVVFTIFIGLLLLVVPDRLLLFVLKKRAGKKGPSIEVLLDKAKLVDVDLKKRFIFAFNQNHYDLKNKKSLFDFKYIKLKRDLLFKLIF